MTTFFESDECTHEKKVENLKKLFGAEICVIDKKRVGHSKNSVCDIKIM